MTWDRILTITDYYDGPLRGIAEVSGQPHVYERELDREGDEYGETYLVSPLAMELVELALEDWEIWLRWHAAYEKGEASIDTHPALPEDQDRHRFLMLAIGDMQLDPSTAKRLKAEFRDLRVNGGWTGTEVRWLLGSEK
jgi:hypothetical protein